ncbi:MAG: hypothetical protein N2559_02700 [Anaerolineae bacterium]|nr:hypothetical protein [Anaerolineae bacterium]
MDETSYPARPVLGRLLALDLRPMRPLTLLGPAAAALCGAIASGGLNGQWRSWVTLILVILLCDVLIGAWRASWLHADWRVALPRSLANARIWYMLPDEASSSRMARWARALTQRVMLVRYGIWPLIDSEIIGMLIAGLFALCLAALFNPIALALTLAALALALIEGQVSERHTLGLRALIELTLPWFIAQSAFEYFSYLSLFFVLLLTIVYRALLGLIHARQERWYVWNNIAHLVIALALFASHAPIQAALVALALLAQRLWQMRWQSEGAAREYVQHIQSYVLATMVVVSLSLGLLPR